MQKEFENVFHIGDERRPSAGFCRVVGKSVIILCQFVYGLYWLAGLAGVAHLTNVATWNDNALIVAVASLIVVAIGSLLVALMLVVVLAAGVIVYQYGAADD